jgi:hypothetical protein
MNQPAQKLRNNEYASCFFWHQRFQMNLTSTEKLQIIAFLNSL